MSRQHVQVLIAGAGPAGLIAAAALARQGLEVALADPAPPGPEVGQGAQDQRSTAFLRPARRLFEQLDLWEALAPDATPLEALRIVDLAAEGQAIRASRIFRGGQHGTGPFGWNVPNAALKAQLARHLARAPRVRIVPAGVVRLLTRSEAPALVTLQDGTQWEADLVIGADGRDSRVREAAGITARTTRYGQKALAFVASHAAPHGLVSTEIYRAGGPLTTVPLPDRDGRPASAIIWMEDGPEAERLAGLPAAEFDAALTARSAGLLGPMHLASARAIWPVMTRRAARMTAPRVALMAEAAHVLPPIGAQGLNSSMRDVSALLEAVSRHAPGSSSMLEDYARAREGDIAARAAAIDGFNRITRSGAPLMQDLRLSGLALLHDVAPLRRALVRAGLGE